MFLGLCYAWEGSMKLGLIRMPDLHPMRGEQRAIENLLDLANSLEIDLAYFPRLGPQQISRPHAFRNNHLKIGLDASAFGLLSPRDLEIAIREVNERFEGQLCLGVRMCSGNGSTQSRVEAQNYETMFSQAPSGNAPSVPSRFPMKAPCPKIIGLPMNGSLQEAAVAAARGYDPLTPSWLSHRDVAHHWPAIVKGATLALRRARPSHWQLARSIVVHDDPATVDAYVFGARSPIRAYYSRLARHGLIDSNIDGALKKLVIAGSAKKVAENVLTLQEAVGEFGTLHVVDHAGRDPEMTRNTMVRLAQDVMPMVTKIGADTSKELERT